MVHTRRRGKLESGEVSRTGDIEESPRTVGFVGKTEEKDGEADNDSENGQRASREDGASDIMVPEASIDGLKTPLDAPLTPRQGILKPPPKKRRRLHSWTDERYKAAQKSMEAVEEGGEAVVKSPTGRTIHGITRDWVRNIQILTTEEERPSDPVGYMIPFLRERMARRICQVEDLALFPPFMAVGSIAMEARLATRELIYKLHRWTPSRIAQALISLGASILFYCTYHDQGLRFRLRDNHHGVVSLVGEALSMITIGEDMEKAISSAQAAQLSESSVDSQKWVVSMVYVCEALSCVTHLRSASVIARSMPIYPDFNSPSRHKRPRRQPQKKARVASAE